MSDLYITALCPEHGLTEHYALAAKEAECCRCGHVSRREDGDFVAWRVDLYPTEIGDPT